MDAAVESRNLDEAASISDTLASREFASKVAIAFDCVEYVKKQKVSN